MPMQFGNVGGSRGMHQPRGSQSGGLMGGYGSRFQRDNMINAALNAGAYGGKINGSGGGGCMFAYAPKNPEAVAEAIEKVGGKAHIVESTAGSTLFRN